MKTKNLLSLLAVAAGTFALPVISFGQPVFEYELKVDSGSGLGGVEIGAYITVDFSTAGKIVLTLENTGPAESQISAFFLLRPSYVGGGAVGVEDMDSESIVPPDGFTADWAYIDKPSEVPGIGSMFNYSDFNINMDDYFGAQYVPPPTNRLDLNDKAVFTFDLDSTNPIDLDAWTGSQVPRVLLRIQGIQPGGLSARGYDNLIPEPRLIGALAMIGLGGVLYARRRLTSKK